MKILKLVRQSSLVNQIRDRIPHRVVNTFRHLPNAAAAAAYYGYPGQKMKIIGVTGSDGKTTTVTGIHHILKTAGKKVAMISTVKAAIGNKFQDTGFHVTTPDPWLMQKLLKEMWVEKTREVVLEVTSHGLEQHRLEGINFEIGVITNVSHEHLDYHQNFERYLMAKAKLLRKVKVAILNRDDRSYDPLAKYLRKYNPKAQIITYGIEAKEVNFRAVQIEAGPEGLSFRCMIKNAKKLAPFPASIQIRLRLIGRYNVSNALAMIAVSAILKIPSATVRQALASYPQIPGRMEVISLPKAKNIRAIVDFAHTPNAVANVLPTLREHYLTEPDSKGRLIVVFGSAGLRDTTKRPLMGKAAAAQADVIILTAEDPRTEDVNQIIDQISTGCLEAGAKEVKSQLLRSATPGKVEASTPLLLGGVRGRSSENRAVFIRVPDRQQAINLAIQTARPGDVVAILGKGHETTMCFGTTEVPWSDQEAVEKSINS